MSAFGPFLRRLTAEKSAWLSSFDGEPGAANLRQHAHPEWCIRHRLSAGTLTDTARTRIVRMPRARSGATFFFNVVHNEWSEGAKKKRKVDHVHMCLGGVLGRGFFRVANLNGGRDAPPRFPSASATNPAVTLSLVNAAVTDSSHHTAGKKAKKAAKGGRGNDRRVERAGGTTHRRLVARGWRRRPWHRRAYAPRF